MVAVNELFLPQSESSMLMADYGFRYYDPGMGRWLNRDPIGEAGGINLYAMASNTLLHHLDLLGLKSISVSYDLAEDIDAPWGTGATDVDSWQEILNDLKDRISKGGDFDPKCNCIKRLYLGGHGEPGNFSTHPIESGAGDINDFEFDWYFERRIQI